MVASAPEVGHSGRPSNPWAIVRFDGVRAVPWQPPNGEQLPSNYVESLPVARDGALWIGTRKGLASWKDGKLTQYPEVAGQVISLVEDHEGTVWFEMPAPGRLCAIQGAKVQCSGAGSLSMWATGLCEDHKGNLWVSAQTGVWRWGPGTPEHYMFPRGGVRVRSLFEDDDGALLLDTSDGLKQLVLGKIQSYANLSAHYLLRCTLARQLASPANRPQATVPG